MGKASSTHTGNLIGATNPRGPRAAETEGGALTDGEPAGRLPRAQALQGGARAAEALGVVGGDEVRDARAGAGGRQGPELVRETGILGIGIRGGDRRREREERERLLREAGTAPAGEQKYETAEEEKKRLEREERERILAAGGSSSFDPDSKQPPEGDSDLPPYQEF